MSQQALFVRLVGQINTLVKVLTMPDNPIKEKLIADDIVRLWAEAWVVYPREMREAFQRRQTQMTKVILGLCRESDCLELVPKKIENLGRHLCDTHLRKVEEDESEEEVVQ